MGISGMRAVLKTTVQFALAIVFALHAGAQSTSAPASQTTPTQEPAPASQPAAAQQMEPAGTSTNPPAASSAVPKKPADSAASSDDSLTTIRTTINEVNVVFTVTDKHGRRITDLKQADFRFLDDNKPPAEVRSFSAETNLPLQVGLLIDASNSVRDRFKFEQESAVEFLNQIVRRRYDQAFVVGFDATRRLRRTSPTTRMLWGVESTSCARAAAQPCTMRSTLPAATSCSRHPRVRPCGEPSSCSATARTT